jgi:hemerythrin-like domain-containing protein
MVKQVTDPIAQFMQEHEETLYQLKKLSRASKSLAENGYSKVHHDQIRAALRFINEEVNHHNRKEEEALFPILERYVEGPTQLMRKDHRELHRRFKRLQTAVSRVERDRKSVRAAKELAGVTAEVVHIFVNHIHKENYVLFPLVQRFLTREELREVARKMT